MKYNRELLNDVHASSDLIPKQIYKDKIITLENITSINQKFMGGGMSQNYLSIPWFEYYFDTHNFEYMVEVGSQKGCLSTYFANFAGITEKMFFETYELFPDKDWSTREYEGVGHWYEKLADLSPYINYYHDDIFSEPVKQHIMENIAEFKTFMFCDGGDKVKEFNTYAPLLKSGDRIAVHDWNQEIFYHQIKEVATEHGLEPDEPFATSAQQFQTWIMPFKKR